MSKKTNTPPSKKILNQLRAAVLGANDGIVSTSSVLMGVAGAGGQNKAILTAGMAALVAGALSMAVGEYVSVASQRDAEEAHAASTNEKDVEFTSPMQAAVASIISFAVGGLVPFIAVIIAPATYKIPAIVAAVFVALLLTGYFSASAGNSSRIRAMNRIVIGGLLAMAITYYIGTLFGTFFA